MKSATPFFIGLLFQVVTLTAQVQPLPTQTPQDPAQNFFEQHSPGNRQRFGGPGGMATPRNYQLQLEIQRGDKVARYHFALNGGSLNTELADKFGESGQPGEQRFIQFNATLMPLADEAADVQLMLSRVRSNKVRSGDHEVVQSRSVPLSTKVTLAPGTPVTIFDDQEEKITVSLTRLVSGLTEREQCIHNLHMIDGAKVQWALQKKQSAGEPVDEASVNRYIKGGGPKCPAGGTYTYGDVGEDPACSVPGHSLR